MPIKIQRKRIRVQKLPFVGITLIIFISCGLYSGLETTYYTYQNPGVPVEFNGYKIAFVSDFHCKKFGRHEEKLIQSIVACEPDIVVFTGDMIDGSHEDLTPVKELLAALNGKYPMYAVSGNHEYDDYNRYQELLDYYREYGVIYLDDNQDIITRGSGNLGLYGKKYVGNSFTTEYLQGPDNELAQFNIMLCHDATTFPVMSASGFDLMLSGHTHGGIIRLPFLGGLINNNASLIAEYENGIYLKNNCTLISSRGLGDAMLPRFYNRPELICVTLRTE